MNHFASMPLRLAGISALVAGIFYMIVGLVHPLETLSSVTTGRWEFVHVLASAFFFFGLLGLVGLYGRQMKEAGPLGLAGFVLLSLWMVLTVPFTVAEIFLLPPLVSEAPRFVEGFLGIFIGVASDVDFGVLPTLWVLSGVVYILGGVLFGIATFRAGVLPRWAGALLAVGTASSLAGALLPAEYKAIVTLPVGFALAWLGFALASERPAAATDAVQGRGGPRLPLTGAEPVP